MIADPEITQHSISVNDQFLIIASDGVWEFISSQEAVDIVAASISEGAEIARKNLIREATDRYRTTNT